MSFAFALGLATLNQQQQIIEVYYPEPECGLSSERSAQLQALLGQHAKVVSSLDAKQKQSLAPLVGSLSQQLLQAELQANQAVVAVLLNEDSKPGSVAEAFLKLHLLSHRLIQPHGQVLDGIFGTLHNLAWTNEGAIDLADLADRQLQARLAGRPLMVFCVDKFPRMADYVVPSGVRLADTSRLRLGAHVGEGTTVMHEGFINFNAGTLGTSMVEGRISAGVTVGSGTDLGGGCSTMGTLSGGGNIVIKLGENCLLGANAGTGIPLGNRCTIESGLYITAGTKVQMLDASGQASQVVKARELAGKDDLLFRRNSLTGGIECLTNKSAVELNAELHNN